jgi:hypothetical protein
MQSCASAAKLRGGGPNLETGVNTMASSSSDSSNLAEFRS